MRILTENLIAESTTLSMTNPDADFPITQLYSNMLEEIVQAATSSTTITATFDSDQTLNCLFFGYHNITSITINFKNISDSIINTYTLNYPSQMVRYYLPTQITGVRKIEIIILSGSVVFIGNFSCGIYTQLYNLRQPINIIYKITSEFEQTNGGQSLHRSGIRLANFAINLGKNTDEQHDTFFEAFDRVMLGKTFWLDRNEDLASRAPKFGIFDVEPSTNEDNQFIDIFTSFLEAR